MLQDFYSVSDHFWTLSLKVWKSVLLSYRNQSNDLQSIGDFLWNICYLVKMRRLFDVSLLPKNFLSRFFVILIFGYYKSLVDARLFPVELTLKFEIFPSGCFGSIPADVVYLYSKVLFSFNIFSFMFNSFSTFIQQIFLFIHKILVLHPIVLFSFVLYFKYIFNYLISIIPKISFKILIFIGETYSVAVPEAVIQTCSVKKVFLDISQMLFVYQIN